MSDISSKYSIELWTPNGVLLADFSGRASNRRVVKTRNEADEITWSMDLDEFERYCDLIHTHPRALLVNGQTEVRIKRGSEYLSGGQLSYKNVTVNENKKSIELRATGFLNLLKDRFTGGSREFTAEEVTTIAWTLIDESQSLTNGDFGITQGSLVAAGLNNIVYQRRNIKEAIIDLTNDITRSFDIEITYDKVFNTYKQQGNDRPDIIFEYPGNIKNFSLPDDATNLANQVVIFGSGNGDVSGSFAQEDDLGSQAGLKLRQRLLTANGFNDTQNTLTDRAKSELEAWAYSFEIPQLVIDGNIAPFITDYGIGDRVRVNLQGLKSTEHINGIYRLEKYELSIDDEDNEEIKLSLV